MSRSMLQLPFQITNKPNKQIKNEDFQTEDGKHVGQFVDLLWYFSIISFLQEAMSG